MRRTSGPAFPVVQQQMKAMPFVRSNLNENSTVGSGNVLHTLEESCIGIGRHLPDGPFLATHYPPGNILTSNGEPIDPVQRFWNHSRCHLNRNLMRISPRINGNTAIRKFFDQQLVKDHVPVRAQVEAEQTRVFDHPDAVVHVWIGHCSGCQLSHPKGSAGEDPHNSRLAGSPCPVGLIRKLELYRLRV